MSTSSSGSMHLAASIRPSVFSWASRASLRVVMVQAPSLRNARYGRDIPRKAIRSMEAVFGALVVAGLGPRDRKRIGKPTLRFCKHGQLHRCVQPMRSALDELRNPEAHPLAGCGTIGALTFHSCRPAHPRPLPGGRNLLHTVQPEGSAPPREQTPGDSSQDADQRHGGPRQFAVPSAGCQFTKRRPRC